MSTVTASDWIKGISLSVLASIIGGASKLAIRKSWLLQHEQDEEESRLNRSFIENINDEEPETLHDVYRSIDHESDVGTSTRFVDEASEGQESSASSSQSSSSDDGGHDDTASAHRRRRSFAVPSEAGGSHEIRRDTVWMIAWFLRGSGMIGMTFLNPACSVMAMNYASPSILAPFSGLTLVWIVLLSQPLIREKPTVRQIIAASLIILGEVLVAIFGDHTNEEDMTIQKVTESYKHPPFLIYFAVTCLWIMLLIVWMKHSTNPTLKRFAWGVAGGSITGFQNFLKDTLTLVKVRAPEESLPWYTSLLAILAIVTAFTGLLFLTACMKRYDATYSAAMFVGSFVVNASIMSAVHYSTFAHLRGIVNWIFYPGGLLVLMGGVWMLVKEKGAQPRRTEGSLARRDADSVASASSAAARVELVRLYLKNAHSIFFMRSCGISHIPTYSPCSRNLLS